MAMNHAIGAGTMRDHSPSGLRVTATLASLVLLLVACGASTSSSGAPSSQSAGTGTTVTMSGLAFTVAEITVPVGEVTFVNKDGVGHLVAQGDNGKEAASPGFQKTAIAPNSQGVITFSAAGDIHVTCLIHPAMHLIVHVQ
jgi:plastocyanin